jgi:bifunctional non-homologous end joining protein LigD
MLWSPVRPVRARVKAAGFILPCQPSPVDRPPSGPEWQHEIKWDGYRLIGRQQGGRVRLWARTGTDYTRCLDRIRAAVAALPVTSAVLDGEAVAFGDDDCANFGALRSVEGRAGAILIAYDLLELDGEDIRREPLQLRRARLARLLSRARRQSAHEVASGIMLSEAIEGNIGEVMFRQACLMGLQGIISKRLGSPYISGRTRAWLKTKNPNFQRS